jgi:hypothetical protein
MMAPDLPLTRAQHEMIATVVNDVAILQITMIASWFNDINRMADALGVGRDAAHAAGDRHRRGGVPDAAGPALRIDPTAGD